MTWKKNPRTITKEQFSDKTTIDGNRIDNAMDDVVDRVNDIPYGDLRKRWVPITYVAGWTPQTPYTLDGPGPDTTDSAAGEIRGTHHWPWMRVRNYPDEVVTGTFGASTSDDHKFTNPYRLKGVVAPGIKPFGEGSVYAEKPVHIHGPVGEQYAWTRSWFLERPSILDSIDLVLELDHASAGSGFVQYANSFLYGDVAPDGYAPNSDDRGLVITARVDSEFAREDRNMSDVEVLRKDFRINNDKFSTLPLSYRSTAATTYDDFEPKPNPDTLSTNCGASTIQGVHVRLNRLNIPIHQNARLRVSVIIPSYTDGTVTDLGGETMRPNGWNPSGNGGAYPWYQQKVHMVVTMLEEVVGG